MIGKCDHCNGEIIFQKCEGNTIHYGKDVCSNCGKHFRWVRHPEKEGLRIKTSRFDIKQVVSFHKFDNEFCFFCLRTKERLGHFETLTIDHIQELSRGGLDDLTNLQILCSACHKLKNWARLYTNWHFEKREDDT